jgi:SAM-dependent methyltransferase
MATLSPPPQMLKRAFEGLRSACTFWIAPQSLDHVQAIRDAELAVALAYMPDRGRLLEIGAGAGWQARALAALGFDVDAIDLNSSNYLRDRVWPVVDYDGETIPHESGAFDIVFSSNTLEHIPHIDEFQQEIQRVLKPSGRAIHLVPSSSWRVWTNIAYLLKFWRIPFAHGEHASNALTEIYYFRRGWWRRLFSRTGWAVQHQGSNGIFYTGSMLMGLRMPISTRKRLSRWLGGSCNVFVLMRQSIE